MFIWTSMAQLRRFNRYLVPHQKWISNARKKYIPCSHLTWVAGPYPFSFLAAIRKIMAGFVVVSMCAAVRLEFATTHWAAGPQNTRTKANWKEKMFTLSNHDYESWTYVRIFPMYFNSNVHVLFLNALVYQDVHE